MLALGFVIELAFLTSGDLSLASADTTDSFEDSAVSVTAVSVTAGTVGCKGDLSFLLEEPLAVGLPLGVRGVMTDLVVLVLPFSAGG